MRTTKRAMYVSLDGVVENPAWTGPFWSEDLAAMQDTYLQSSDALLLGRVIYEASPPRGRRDQRIRGCGPHLPALSPWPSPPTPRNSGSSPPARAQLGGGGAEFDPGPA